jgi:predicted PurR-regulated permease PerM
VNDKPRSTLLDTSDDSLVVLAIRLVCLGLLGYWTLLIIRPFLTIMIWSAIIAVALYPVFYWLSAKLYGYRALAAFAITLVSLLLMLGPVTWLGLSLADSVRTLMAQLGEGTIVLPRPPEAIKDWPLIGNKAYETWDLASTNLRALLTQAVPYLKPVGGTLLGAAGSFGVNLLKFIAATIISGFLFIPGPALVESIKNILRHLAGARGAMFVDMTGATVRTISRGIIGVAVLQALLAGIGLIIAGVPASGLISFLVLLLGIIQVGPSVILLPLVIWSWFAMDATSAVLFSLYMIPVNLLDNVLRPLVMAKGLGTPIWIILLGVFGGTIAHGMIGLFVGPVILSIAWQLIALWTRSELMASQTVEAN